jgi:hypothetical protein
MPVPEAGLGVTLRSDGLHLDYAFAGSRMLRDLLHGEGQGNRVNIFAGDEACKETMLP